MSRTKLSVGLLVLVLVTAAVILVPMMLQDRDEPVTDDTSADLPHEDIALEAARIMSTWTPAEDFNRTDAELRAKHLMTDELAQSIEAPERPATGQAWRTATEAHATSHPSVELNPYTDASPGTVAIFASWDWISESGDTLPVDGAERIYYFSFTDNGKIHDYTYETIPKYEHDEN